MTDLHQYCCMTCGYTRMLPVHPSEHYRIAELGCERCETIRTFEADYSREAARIKGWV